jgi:hypothetical protein
MIVAGGSKSQHGVIMGNHYAELWQSSAEVAAALATPGSQRLTQIVKDINGASNRRASSVTDCKRSVHVIFKTN